VLFLPVYRANPHQAQLADALESLGIEVTMADPAGPFPLLGAFRRAGRPKVVHLHWTDGIIVARTSVKTVYRALRFIGEVALLKLLGVRVVWTVHNLHSHENTHNTIERLAHTALVRLYHAIIVYNRSAEPLVAAAFRMGDRERRKIVVSSVGNYVGVYPDTIDQQAARERLGLEPGVTVFLHFGLIRPYKGVPELIDAFAGLDGSNLRLLIAGRPSTADLARQIGERAASDPRVHLVLDRVPDDDVQQYMRAADAVVLPFREILSSSSAALAMAFGKPVVAPRAGNIAEMLGEGGGFLYDPNDPDGLSAALRRASAAGDLADRGHQNAARARAVEQSWRLVAQRTRAAYAGLSRAP
jgi:glycosyltransferase involved in cell wall biosynthesis